MTPDYMPKIKVIGQTVQTGELGQTLPSALPPGYAVLCG